MAEFSTGNGLPDVVVTDVAMTTALATGVDDTWKKLLDVVTGEPRSGDYRYAISNSFGFGGHNVALAFGRY
jgi:3-oxoacyl-(acyl-carrier-protein) synthase